MREIIPFRVGISGDFQTTAAGLLEPALQEIFDPLPFVEYSFLPLSQEFTPGQLAGCDAVITLHPRFTADSLANNTRLAVIARWGVGYDMIDVTACTQADVLLAITMDAVRRPVAEAIVAFILALAKKLPAKDKLVRSGHWDLKAQMTGLGLRGKVVGSIGLGNIGGELFRLLQPFNLGRKLAFDPCISQERAQEFGVELVAIETVFAESDFLGINCPLNDKTRGLVDVRFLSLMKPTAYLINTARGPIVQQDALVKALEEGWIAGAGLDVFDPEPLPTDHPLTRMGNVILSPHALAWTDDLYRANGVDACENVLTVLRGEIPRHAANQEVAGRPSFQAKLCALRQRWEMLSLSGSSTNHQQGEEIGFSSSDF